MQKYTDKPKTLRYTVMHYTPMSSPAFTLPIGITAIHKPLSLLPSVELPSPSPDLSVPCHVLLYW